MTTRNCTFNTNRNPKNQKQNIAHIRNEKFSHKNASVADGKGKLKIYRRTKLKVVTFFKGII